MGGSKMGEYEKEFDLGCTVAPPNLAGLVSEFTWRANEQTGYREMVRKSDGFVLERVKLKTYRVQIQKLKQEKTMSATMQQEEKPATLKVSDLRIGLKVHKWTVVGMPRTDERGKRVVDCRCECGFEKPVSVPNLVSNDSKSCGHERGGGSAARNTEAKPETTAGPIAQPVKQKRTYSRKQGAAPEKIAASNGHALTSQPVNFANLSKGIETIANLALMIPAENVEAMLAEIARVEGTLPTGDMLKLTDLRAHLGEGRRTAQAFLSFRQQLEAVEA